jgi:hypothetical protein
MLLLADIGPATGLLQALASSIGTGLVVGGFIGGGHSLVFRGDQQATEEQAAKGGYAGATFGLGALGFDMLMKSFV